MISKKKKKKIIVNNKFTKTDEKRQIRSVSSNRFTEALFNTRKEIIVNNNKSTETDQQKRKKTQITMATVGWSSKPFEASGRMMYQLIFKVSSAEINTL